MAMDYRLPSTYRDYVHTHQLEALSLRRLFIQKIVDARPATVRVVAWMEAMFGLHERFIVQYRATSRFDVPGFFKPAPQVRIEGFRTERTVKFNRRVWVRFDLKYPEVIELEAPIGPHREPKVFQLNRKEWNDVKKMLVPINPQDLAFAAQAA